MNRRSSTRSTKPRRTAAEARTFDAPSLRSIEQVIDAIEARRGEGIHEDCECEPYEDTFTFNRWIDQGYVVKKGEKCLRISTFAKTKGSIEVTNESGETESRDRLRPVSAKLFCKCQVQTKAAWEAARAAQALVAA